MSKYRSIMAAIMVIFFQSVSSEEVKTFKNNAEISIELSSTNQNRLMIKSDKIIKAAFPDGALTYQYDETDGSMYVHPEIEKPFTLFLSSQKGQHLSLTVNSVESLGKTIAFNTYKPRLIRKPKGAVKKEAPFKKEVLAMMNYMTKGINMPGVDVSHVRVSAGHFNNGLRLIRKEIWQGATYKGELLEVYNNSKRVINLNPNWFTGRKSKAIRLSQVTLAPKDKAMLYRIEEVSRG